MELERYLNQAFSCDCGRGHFVPMRRLCTDIWGVDFSAELAELLGGKRATVLCDAHTHAVNERVCAYLRERGWTLAVREFAPEGPLFNDEAAVGAAMFDAPPGKTDGILAIGGGTITDLGRFVGSRLQKPFVLVMTCPSMDGYASNVAGMLIGGKKKVLKDCAFPQGVFGDVETLRAAPWDLVKSGFGDMLGKRTALADWVLARRVNGDYFCPLIARLADESSNACIACLDGLIARDGEAVLTLTDALLLTGVNMALCDDTRPASGSEHIFSHYLVGSAIDRGLPAPSHGETVGFGTLVSACLYEFLLARPPEELSDAADELRRYLITPEEVFALLERSGIGGRVEDHLPGGEALAEMIRSSAGPEKRYTILRYLAGRGMLEDGIKHVLARMR